MSVFPMIFAMCLAVPLLLPIEGFESVPPLAAAASLLSIPWMVAQICMDAVAHREGSALRLAVLLFIAVAIASWISGALTFGISASASLSFVNWIALAGLVVAGQSLLTTPRRLNWMLNGWLTCHVVICAGAVIFLMITFGAQMVSSTERGPFQHAMQAIFPNWPNYLGLAIATAICVAYGRMAGGTRSFAAKVQLAILVAGLLVTFSRGSYLACIAGVAAIRMATGQRRRTVIMFAVGGTFILLVLLFVPAVNFLVRATFTPDTSQSIGVLERLAFAREALRVWWAHPTFGIGFAQFSQVVDPSSVYLGNSVQHDLGSVHNEYVTTLLKSGYAGLFSLMLLVVMGYRKLKLLTNHRDPEIRKMALGGIGICITLLVDGFTLESLRTVGVSGVFLAMLGSADAIARRAEIPLREQSAQSDHGNQAGLQST
ncbi:MAG TPA: O-antigen ligase family protein [Povalibacter sp.]|nr:O-antigen ligase family protein [Povalibacter sp.]